MREEIQKGHQKPDIGYLKVGNQGNENGSVGEVQRLCSIVKLRL